MATTVYVTFAVVLSDATLVTQYQAAFPSGLTGVSPATAATTYSAPINNAGGAQPSPPRIDLFGGGGILTTTVASATYAAGFTVDAYGNLYVLAGAPGGTIAWKGVFNLEPVGTGVAARNPIMARRFGTGFEIPHNKAAIANTVANSPYSCCRDSSRTPDGFGFPYRNESGTSVIGTLPGSTYDSWERFYIRPRVFPSTALGTTPLQDAFWFVNDTVESSNPSINLHMTSTGTLKLYNQGAQTYPGTLLGTSRAIDLNTWARIDLLFYFKNASYSPNSGAVALYINGVLQFRVTCDGTAGAGGGAGGLFTLAFHSTSTFFQNGGTYNGLELDIDDWSNSAIPQTLDGLDWIYGSHYKLLHATGFGTTNSTNWVGDYRMMNSNPVNSEQNGTDNANSLVLTSQAVSTIDLTTDYQDWQLGCIFMRSLVMSKTTTIAAGQTIGRITTAAGVVSAAAVGQITSGGWGETYWAIGSTGGANQSSQSVEHEPTALYPLELTYAASATTAQRISAILAEAEFLGIWGPGDDNNNGLPPVNIHNSPYPDSEWAHTTSSNPIGPVSVVSGTYTGDNLGRDIVTTSPIHWFWVRPVGSAIVGGMWFSSLAAAKHAFQGIPAPQKGGQRARLTTGNIGQFQISGSNNNINASATVYQWVAFSDPAMRFLINGYVAHKTGVSSIANPLRDANFLPLGVFFNKDTVGSALTTHYFKGPGHATNAADLLDTGVSATVAAIGTGSITTKSALHAALPGTGYSAWRKNDTVTTGAVDVTTYIGDGTGARNITLVLGGRSPIFALISADNGPAYFRDPSHLTTHSCTLAGVDSTTAITAGTADQLTVGATLNTNLIVYQVFALAGTVQAGWSPNPPGGVPIFPVDTIPRPGPVGIGPFADPDTKGWWRSENGFTGAADIIQTPQVPKHPRTWSKILAFTTGSNLGTLGGSPGVATAVKNHLIYAGDDYFVNANEPPIRIFDGLSDRMMASVPSVTPGTPPLAIMSMMQQAGMIYLSTLDSGSSASDYAGRVFSFDPNSQVLTPIGAQFTGGEVPYALTWHMDRLWCGTNKGNGAACKVYFFRPGIDTAWTQDHTLSTETTGGVCSMKSFKGKLYVGTDNTTSTAAKILVRSSDATWAVSFTGPGSSAYNGFLSMSVFQDALYATYWDKDVTSRVYQLTGTTWGAVYEGVSATLRPLIAQFTWDNHLYVIGGGQNYGAVLIRSGNGTSFEDLTTYLTGGTTTQTTLPLIGNVSL